MAISRVTAHDGTGTSSAAFGGTPTSGNLLLSITYGNNSGVTISGWTQVVQKVLVASSEIITLFAKTSAGTEGTVTPATGLTFNTAVCEYSGAANPFATDGTAGGTINTGSVTSLTTASITTTNANDLIFTVCGLNDDTGASWTTATAILKNSFLFAGENIVSSTQSGYTDTAHWTNSSNAATLIAAFKAASVSTLSVSVSDTTTTSEAINVTKVYTVHSVDITVANETQSRQDLTFGGAYFGVAYFGGSPYFNNDILTLVDNVSVSDNTSHVEGITVSITGGTPSLNVSDTLNTTEVVTSLTPFLLVGVHDNLGTSESLTILIIDNISVNDIEGTSEFIALSITENISINDTVNTSEVLMMQDQDGIAVMDTVGTTENTVESIPFLLINVNDSVSTNETILLNDIEIEGVSDTTSTSETIKLLLVSLVSVSDSTSTSESIFLLNIENILVNDSTSTSENVTVTIVAIGSLSINVSDSTVTSESITIVIIVFISVSDTEGTSESINQTLVFDIHMDPAHWLEGPGVKVV